MNARPLVHRLLALCLALAASACSGVAALDAGAPAPPAEEQAAIRAQVDKALAEGRFNAAWSQEVAAGGERARLEAIAVAALEGRSRYAGAMFDALRERHGGLGEAARARVDALSMQARDKALWSRAVELQLVAADDPPAYTAAWAVYRAAPADVAPTLLEAIREARADREESAD